MSKNYIELQGSDLTESRFKARIRKALKNHPTLSGWEISKDLGQTDGINLRTQNEICKDLIGDVQYYLKGAYNFIYEFTHYEGNKGHGYFYLTETTN